VKGEFNFMCDYVIARKNWRGKKGKRRKSEEEGYIFATR
jgi:hypothetical protein